MRTGFGWLLAVGAVLVWVGVGCVSPLPQPPRNLAELARHEGSNPRPYTPRAVLLYNLQRVTSPALPEGRRLESLRVVKKLSSAGEETGAALTAVVADGSTPKPVRHGALAVLAGLGQPGLARHVAQALRETDDAGFRSALLEWLELNPLPEALPDVVILWAAEARPGDHDEARFRRIVAAMSGRQWDQALLEGLNSPGFEARGSAIEVLRGRIQTDVLRERIAALAARTEAVRALQDFARNFAYVPRTRHELLDTVRAHLAREGGEVRTVQAAAWWRTMSQYRFNIRDLYLLRHLSADPMRTARLSRVQLRLEVANAFGVRGVGAEARPRIRRGRVVSLKAQMETLTVADLWNLLLLDGMFARKSTRQRFRIAADADRADRQTQWGGLVFYGSGQPQAQLYPPADRRGDDSYVPSGRMLLAARNALCFFIGHFSRRLPRGEEAGPTERELALAKAKNLYGVAVTSLSAGRLNVAYFNPDGVVVDMGDYPPVR